MKKIKIQIKIGIIVGLAGMTLLGVNVNAQENTCPVINGSQLLQCPRSGNCVNNLNSCPVVSTNPTGSTSGVLGSFTQKCSGILIAKDTSDAEACAKLAEEQGRALGYQIECSVQSNSYTMNVPASAQSQLEANGYTGITSIPGGLISVPVTDNIGTCTINGQSGFDPRSLVGYSSNQPGYVVPDPIKGVSTAYGSGYNINSMWYSVPCTIVDNIEGRAGSLSGATTCTSGAKSYFGSPNPPDWVTQNAPINNSNQNTNNTSSNRGSVNTTNNNLARSSTSTNSIPSPASYTQNIMSLLNRLINNARAMIGQRPLATTNPTGTPTNTGSNNNTPPTGTNTNNTPTNNQNITYGPGESLSSARFIRVETAEMGWISWREIEIYSGNTKLTPIGASGSGGSYVDNTSSPSRAIDGNTNTAWNAGETNPNCMILGNSSCPRSTRNAYIVVDLGAPRNVTKIRLAQNGDTWTENTKIFVSNAGTNFTQIASFVAPMRDGEWVEYPYPIASAAPSLTFTINGGKEATVNTVNSNQTIDFAWNATNAEILSVNVSEIGGNRSWNIPPSSLSIADYMFDPLDTNFAMGSYYNSLTNWQKVLPPSGTHGMWIPQGQPGIYNPSIAGKSFTITLKAKQRYGGAEVSDSVVIKF